MAKQTKPKEETKSYLEPAMAFEGHKNEFIEHVKAKEPELIAVGYAKIPGTNNYAAYTIYFKNNEIVKMVVGQPNLKTIAEDQAKADFVALIVDQNEEF